jgi:hypothetical protein
MFHALLYEQAPASANRPQMGLGYPKAHLTCVFRIEFFVFGILRKYYGKDIVHSYLTAQWRIVNPLLAILVLCRMGEERN